jgi:Flp pilus assembly protein TadD
MGQVHHGSATTTAAVRRAIQHSQESLRTLAERYGINQKTRGEVEEANLGRRSADRSERAEVDGAFDRGRGHHGDALGSVEIHRELITAAR